MAGCIYDQGFLNIPANPTPPTVDFTEDESLTPIRRPALNNNEHEYQEGKNPTGTAAVPIAAPNSSGNNPAHATEKNLSKEINSSSKGNDNFWGNSSTNSTINKSPSNSSKPIFSRPKKPLIKILHQEGIQELFLQTELLLLGHPLQQKHPFSIKFPK